MKYRNPENCNHTLVEEDEEHRVYCRQCGKEIVKLNKYTTTIAVGKSHE
jgi:hypothetical protein